MSLFDPRLAAAITGNPVPARRGMADRIVQHTAALCDLSPDDILGDSRQRRITAARQLAMHIAWDALGLSAPQVGALFQRDHSCVVQARRRIEARMTPDLAEAIALIRSRAGVPA